MGYVLLYRSFYQIMLADRVRCEKTTTALIVAGKEDKLVTPDRSRAMLERFASASLHEHENGHVVDASVETTNAIKAFVAKTLTPNESK